MKKPENPPAFPTGYERPAPDEKGMTLRDYFAAAALQGILAGLDMDASEVSDQIACKSYIVADAMLKARA